MTPLPDDATRDFNSALSYFPGSDPPPERIGRYRVEKLLSKGGFGSVYLAQDISLDRKVAIKLPHRSLVSNPGNADGFLAEARMAAMLKHPNIVPVFDVGSTGEFPIFVVTEFIDGGDLASRLVGGPLPINDAVRIAADVAGALDHAHRLGLVHRDIKPANIFLDRHGRAYVGDFGLALREPDIGIGLRHAGTPHYMSPEQARGEGHRVDGRSDIFSLGVVLYEMLTGKKPFQAANTAALLAEIVNIEARPPRQMRDGIPYEVELICLKALSKEPSERHATGGDLASNLLVLLTECEPRSDSYYGSGCGNRVDRTCVENQAPACRLADLAQE